jgi:hypothetical protein
MGAAVPYRGRHVFWSEIFWSEHRASDKRVTVFHPLLLLLRSVISHLWLLHILSEFYCSKPLLLLLWMLSSFTCTCIVNSPFSSGIKLVLLSYIQGHYVVSLQRLKEPKKEQRTWVVSSRGFRCSLNIIIGRNQRQRRHPITTN